MKKIRIDIKFTKLKTNHGDATEKAKDRYEIRIDESDPVETQIDTMGHEFAHLLSWMYAPMDVDAVRQEKFADRAGAAFARAFRKMRKGE